MSAGNATGPTPGSHVVADQSAAIAFLGEPASYGLTGEAVERIDTHGAIVFLAGERAYKMKRAVRFPYMDFSTVQKRRKAVERELRFNRRTAPGLYLGAMALLRDRGGALRLGEIQAEGPDDALERQDKELEPVEWLVVMRRFDQQRLFDRMARDGELGPGHLDALGEVVAAFHESAEPVQRAGAPALAAVIEENAEEFLEHPVFFADREARLLTERSRLWLTRLCDLLDQRAEEGLLRRCHGDLHLRNIVLLDGRPTLFDCIEFNDEIACIDVLYDLAFLLMDLERRGMSAAANRLLNRYLQHRHDFSGLAGLPLFLSLRAAIRAKVTASALAGQRGPEARHDLLEALRGYFTAASDYLNPAPPCLVAIGGFSGSGKTTLARALAPDLGAAPGAVLLRSDQIRKARFGVAEDQALPEAAYRPEVSREVYDEMLQTAEIALRAGQAVVLDAVFNKQESRAVAEALAKRRAVAFTGLWLDAPRDVLLRRVGARRGDASDATTAVVESQLEHGPGALDWISLDAVPEPSAVLRAARERLRAS